MEDPKFDAASQCIGSSSTAWEHRAAQGPQFPPDVPFVSDLQQNVKAVLGDDDRRKFGLSTEAMGDAPLKDARQTFLEGQGG